MKKIALMLESAREKKRKVQMSLVQRNPLTYTH